MSMMNACAEIGMQPNSFSRRRLLGLGAEVGIAAATGGLVLPTLVDGRAEAAVPEIPWVTKSPRLPESASIAYVEKYRKTLRNVVKKNVEIFTSSDYDSLLQSQGEAHKQYFDIMGYKQVSAPWVDLEPENTQPHVHRFLSKDKDPLTPFPNIGLGQIMGNIEGFRNFAFQMSGGFYLGRSEAEDDEGNINNIGYYGLTIGDSKEGTVPLVKVVLPINYGWVKNDRNMSQDIGFLVRSDDRKNYQGIISVGDDPNFTYLHDLLPLLDQNLGTLHLIQVNFAGTQTGVEEIATRLKYPLKYYHPEWLAAESENTLQVGYDLQNAVLNVASQQGYVFNELRDFVPVQSHIVDVVPDVANANLADFLSALPDSDFYRSPDNVVLPDDKIIALPRAREVLITPRSFMG